MSRRPQPPLPQTELHENLITTLFSTINALFGGFEQVFEDVCDPRQKGKITYSVGQICWTAVLLFLERLAARSQVAQLFSLGDLAQENIGQLLDLKTLPHGDTIDYLFRKLGHVQVQKAVSQAAIHLMLEHQMPNAQLSNGDWRIVVDGVEFFSSNKPLFPGCNQRKLRDGTVQYFAKALEAKLVCETGEVYSICTEFIEEQTPGQTKQDCEQAAFYRLAANLQTLLPPQTPLCLIMDALYAVFPVFDLCQKKGWRFLITLKDNDLKTVVRDFEAHKKAANRLTNDDPTDKGYRRLRQVDWQEGIDYQNIKLNVVRLMETTAGKTTKFQYVTNLPLNEFTALDAATQGRNRWKIENQGFNVQKNQGFDLDHAYGKDRKAYKIYYLLLQLAHTLTQLMELSSHLNPAFRQRIKTQKNLFIWLTNAVRNYKMTPAKIKKWRRLKGSFSFPQLPKLLANNSS